MSKRYKRNSLKISVWNVNGYKCKGVNKFHQPDFIKNIVSQDIFCLQETHCDLENCLQLPDFPRPVHLIRAKSKHTGRRFGGLSVYIRDTIRPGVKFLNNRCNDYIWIKLDNSFFGLLEDIYVCFIYNPPENTSYSKNLEYNILDLVEEDIINYSTSGK